MIIDTVPYEKLLELVEAKQLDITTVNLADVTADFIKHIESLDNNIDPRILSEFVAIAAKLILIKSKALLPNLTLTDEEEADVQQLEARLLLYQQFRQAGEHLKRIWHANRPLAARSLLMNHGQSFRPPQQLTTLDLLSALASVSVEIKQLLPETQNIQINLISLEEKMEELIQKLNQQPQQQLEQLVSNKSRAEVVVIFLAVLHLLKKQMVKVDQNQWINIA